MDGIICLSLGVKARLSSPFYTAPEQIITRIDAIILELETLRHQVLNTPTNIYRPPVAEVQALVKELRGKYAVGGSLTQAMMDEHRLEL